MIKKILILSFILFSLTGCQSIRHVLNLKTQVKLDFIVDDSINPDSDGRASPVVIHTFQLKDDRLFRREDFLSLYSDARGRLGDELIDVKKLKELVPSMNRMDTLEVTHDTQYLGLMAEFMQYEGAQSILVLPIRSHNKNKYSIEIKSNEMKFFKEEGLKSETSEQKSGKAQKSNRRQRISR